MNQNLKHIQLTTNTAKRFAVQTEKGSAVRAICPSAHMWTAAYPVTGGGAV